MRIVSNTSGRDTRFIKSVFTKVHAYMCKLENRKAPNWKNLRVKIEGRDENYHSGRAFYNGRGHGDWDVFLTIPRPFTKGTVWHTEGKKGKPMTYTVHELGDIVYHELMHTYGYKHSQYSDITKKELDKLFPEVVNVPAAAEKPKPDKVKLRYEAMLKREKQWGSKLKRAENALRKVQKERRAYERRHAERIAV